MQIEHELKQKSFKDTRHKGYLNLLFTYNWINSIARYAFANSDITTQQYNVLRILKGSHPRLMHANEIKAVMIDKSPDLTRLIDRLVEKGYVTRQVCQDNRRMVEIGITKKGMQKIAELEPAIQKAVQPMYNLSEREAEQLSQLLDKIRK
jgi:DNA-binding MarR family transcriptional regulator